MGIKSLLLAGGLALGAANASAQTIDALMTPGRDTMPRVGDSFLTRFPFVERKGRAAGVVLADTIFPVPGYARARRMIYRTDATPNARSYELFSYQCIADKAGSLLAPSKNDDQYLLFIFNQTDLILYFPDTKGRVAIVIDAQVGQHFNIPFPPCPAPRDIQSSAPSGPHS